MTSISDLASPRLGTRRAMRRPAGAVALVATAAAASLLRIGPAPSANVAPPPLPRAGVAAAVVKVRSVAAAAPYIAVRLGLSGSPGAPSRTTDPATGLATTTVEFRAPDGRLASVVTLDARGRLAEAVDLASGPALDVPAVDGATAPAAARRLVAAAGLIAPTAAPLTTWDAGMDAWCVRWTRTIGGIPAPADGLTTWVHRGGQLKALDERISPLAPAPATAIDASSATAAVVAYVGRLHLDRMPGLAYAAPHQAWVAPDGFLEATPPGVSEVLRLVWIVAFSYVPPGWTGRHVVELDVDAGSGALIGGTETA